MINYKWLKNFQLEIIKQLLPYKYEYKKDHLFEKKWMSHNYKKFGFPYIGKYWIPHITISSIKKNNPKSEKFINNFLKSRINFTQKINSISVFKINKNNNKFLYDIKI